MEDHPQLPRFPTYEDELDVVDDVIDGVGDLAAGVGHALNSGYHGLAAAVHGVFGDGASDEDAEEHIREAAQHANNSEDAFEDAWDEFF